MGRTKLMDTAKMKKPKMGNDVSEMDSEIKMPGAKAVKSMADKMVKKSKKGKS